MSNVLYTIETCLKEGVNSDALPGLNNGQWESISLSPADMDTTIGEKRIQHICMNEEEALAVADAIYKLFKKD